MSNIIKETSKDLMNSLDKLVYGVAISSIKGIKTAVYKKLEKEKDEAKQKDKILDKNIDALLNQQNQNTDITNEPQEDTNVDDNINNELQNTDVGNEVTYGTQNTNQNMGGSTNNQPNMNNIYDTNNMDQYGTELSPDIATMEPSLSPTSSDPMEDLSALGLKSNIDLGRLYLMKKIYVKLVSLRDNLKSLSSTELEESKDLINSAIEHFSDVVNNYELYKDKIDNILDIYQKFIVTICNEISDILDNQ